MTARQIYCLEKKKDEGLTNVLISKWGDLKWFWIDEMENGKNECREVGRYALDWINTVALRVAKRFE